MMSKKSPQLRFEGFTDDWEERKLSDLFIKGGSGGTPKSTNKAFYDGDIPFLGISDITKSNGFINNTEKHISSDGLNSSAAWIVSKGAISLAMYASVGKLAILNIDAATSQAFYNMIFDDYDLRDLVYQRLNKANELSEWNKLISTGTQSNLNADKVKNFQMYLPKNHDEIKLISTFFKQIDNTIALHQRKLDLLKEQKKGYLQKMFPKNGAKVPELRFAGFADDWEDRKLKDVTERVRSNDGRMDLPTLTMSASSGWLDQKDRFSGDISGKEKKNYTLLKKGELSYNHGNSKLAKYGVVFSLTNYEEALVPRVYHSFKALENTSADFIEYMFSTKLPDRELGKLVSSGARMDGLLNINYDDFMNIHISTPNYEEQILMSAFFRKLDENIALHQRKLDLLKEQKKGFLQKMFV